MCDYISFISRNIDKKQLAEAEVAETEAGWGWDGDHSCLNLMQSTFNWLLKLFFNLNLLSKSFNCLQAKKPQFAT